MKQLSLVLLAALTLIAGFNASADVPRNGTCFIYANGPCANDRNVKGGVWFIDNDITAHINPVRCAQRAADYYHYCGTQGAAYTVQTAFQSFTGVNLVIAVKNSSSSYITGPSAGGPFGTLLLQK